MRYLVDSDLIIAHLHGDRGTTLFLEALASEGWAISTTVLMEIEEGVLRSADRRATRRKLTCLLQLVEVLPFDAAAARRCATIRHQLRRRERAVRTRALDLLNAAIAIEHRLTLVTRNIADYEDIPRLDLYRREGRSR